MQTFRIGLAALFLATPALAQQQKASAELFARQQGDHVQAAVQIQIDPSWYLYHTDLGDPNAIGSPLKFAWSGPELRFDEPLLPEPKVEQVDNELGKYSFNYHTGTITAWFQAPGTVEVADLRITVTGLTCSHVTDSCVPFRAKDLKPVEAPAGMWGKAPAAFQVVQGGASGLQPSKGDFGFKKERISGGASNNRFGWAPSYEGHIDMRYRVQTDGTRVRGIIELDVEEGFHAYHGPRLEDISPNSPIAAPTTVVFDDVAVDWGTPVYSKPHTESGYSAKGEEIDIAAQPGTWTITTEGTVDLGASLDDLLVTVEGQVCDDNGCVNFRRELSATVEQVSAESWSAQTVSAPPSGQSSDPAPKEGNGQPKSSLWAFLGQAVFWGIFTLLMPCTYPMIPITISFFTKQAIARGGKVMPLALTYGAGIITIFILIGLLAAPVIIPFASHHITNLVIGVLFVYFALTLFGVVNLQPPAFMNKLAGNAARKGGYAGVFLMGATLVVTSFTCTAPFVGTLLGSAATGGGGDGTGYLRIILGMGVFGLVMATPFVFLSLVPGRLQKLPKAGGWMNTLKVYMGFVEVAAALKFFSNADIKLGTGLLPNQVFLIAWAVIFAIAGGYLLVQTFRSGSKSPLQISIGVLTLLLAGYFTTYLNGRPAGDIMSAILPGYHHEGLVKTFGDQRRIPRHKIIIDDLGEAVALARSENKNLILNFTGLT